jgi:hypothetical protein
MPESRTCANSQSRFARELPPGDQVICPRSKVTRAARTHTGVTFQDRGDVSPSSVRVNVLDRSTGVDE